MALMAYDPRIHDQHPVTRFAPATLARRVPGGLILVRLDDDTLVEGADPLHAVVLHELGHHLTLDPSGRFHDTYQRTAQRLADEPLEVRRGLAEGAADAVAGTLWGSPPCPTYERRAREDTAFGRGYRAGSAVLSTPAHS